MRLRWLAQPSPSVAHLQMSGRLLLAVRLTWWGITTSAVLLAIVGFTHGLHNVGLMGPPSVLSALERANIEPAVSIAVGLILPMTLMTTLGVVMFLRQSADPMACFTSLLLITFSAATTRSMFAAQVAVPWLEWPARLTTVIGLGAFVVLWFVFPDGRFIPRSAVVPSAGIIVLLAATPRLSELIAMFPDALSETAGGRWTVALGLYFFLGSVGVGAQVYRYRRRSTALSRQQTKWMMVPAALFTAHISLLVFLPELVGDPGPAWQAWSQLTVAPIALALPVAVAAAITRYRLYDIDRIVSRTVSYSLISAVLAMTFAGVVFVRGRLLPDQSDLAVVASTLGVAALFNPVRQRIQGAVDRRFNRSRYDTKRVVEAFGIRLRSEVRIEDLTGELTTVAATTMQPSTASLWLREPRK